MLRLLAYLIGKGVVTTSLIPDLLGEEVYGLPAVTEKACSGGCNSCIAVCPTDAIEKTASGTSVLVDRGACIGCNLCVQSCQSGTLENDRTTATWAYERNDLIISDLGRQVQTKESPSIFDNSLSLRVISTGCSSCDLELSAASNPIFDIDRYGIQVVASPRFADALVVTGPVPKGMHNAVLSCYQAMAEPKLVIALGTCAISGGVHANGYAEANGIGNILPVDLFIPGCPPHPWQLIKGLIAAKKLIGRKRGGAQSSSPSKHLVQTTVEPTGKLKPKAECEASLPIM